MTQLFTSLYTPIKGMYDSQKRVGVASNNIANANTEGYSRQRVETVSARAYNIDIAGKIESGADTSKITRIRDSFVDSQIRTESGVLGEFESKAELLGHVETAFLEPSENGLNQAMSDMWNSWQELSKNPNDNSTKTVVTQTSENFVTTLNYTASRLADMKTNALDEMENNIYNVNKALSQIDNLNGEIYKAKIRNIEPNELMDQRDLLLDEISKDLNVQIELDKYGRATVKSGNVELVSNNPTKDVSSQISFVNSVEQVGTEYKVTISFGGDGVNNSKTLTLSESDYNTSYSFLEEGAVVETAKEFVDETSVKEFESNMVTGKIKGYQDSFKLIEGYSNTLDNLANSVATRINIINPVEDGTTGKFFTGEVDGKITASNIKFNSEISSDPSKINSDTTSDISATGFGDGSRALAILNLQNGKFSIDSRDSDTLKTSYDSTNMKFTDETNGTTFNKFYNNLISSVGIEKQSADRMVGNQEALLTQLETKRESVSGVSIDEEIANLVLFQNSYAANAKVMSTLVEMLDTLINRTGL